MVTPDGRVKVLDLGLARLRDQTSVDPSLTDSGQVMGTADYMAPEQASGSQEIDTRADVYGLGCTLYHLLAGHPPFPAPQFATTFAKLTAHTREPVPSIRGLRPDVPVGLSRVLDRMLAKSPSDRFATPAEVASALAPFCVEPAATEPEIVPTTEPALTPIAGDQAPRAEADAACGFWSLCAAAAADLWFAYDIIIRVRDEKGRVVSETKVPTGNSVEVEHDGKTQVISPVSAKETPAPPPAAVAIRAATLDLAAGAPLSPLALVSHPSPIAGVRSWTIETRRLRGRWVDRTAVVAYDPKGRWLAVGSADGVIRLRDARDGRLIRALLGHGTAVMALAPHPQQPILASASDQGRSTVRIWDPETGRLLNEFPGFPGGTFASPGLLTARISAGWSRRPSVVEFPDGKSNGSSRPQNSGTRCLAWSPDGNTLAFDLSETGPYLIDVVNSKPLKFLPCPRGVVAALSWSPDGRTLALGHRGINGVSLVNAATGEPVGRLETEAPSEAARLFTRRRRHRDIGRHLSLGRPHSSRAASSTASRV